MKRMLAFLVALSISLLCACDVNAPLRTKMLDYYSNAENYSFLKGKISSVVVDEEERQIHLEIDILTPGHAFTSNPHTGLSQFIIVDFTEEERKLSVDEEVEFMSAPMYFYNGHVLPVVSLKVGDTEIMTFEEGRERYLLWIKQTFD